MKKKLVLTAGLVGVGKSTVAKLIATSTKGTFVDVDEFKRVAVDKNKVANEVDPPEVRWSYYLEALKHADRVFERGCDIVVMDEVFHLRALREQVEEFCRSREIKVLWVEVKSSFKTVKRRLLSKGRQGHILSSEEALRMNRLFSSLFESFLGKNHFVLENEGEGTPPIKDLLEKIDDL